MSYTTADNLAILPENDPSKVEKLARTLGFNLEDIFVLEPADSADKSSFKYTFPSPCTIGDALTKYLDIQGLPKHSTVTQLLAYVTDVDQKNWLRKLLQKENRAQFKSFIEDNAYSIYDLLLNELSSCAVSWNLIYLFYMITFILEKCRGCPQLFLICGPILLSSHTKKYWFFLFSSKCIFIFFTT